MKKKAIINARIIDPSQNMDEIGGVIIDSKGKIEEIGKKINKNEISSSYEVIDAKKIYLYLE